MSEKNSDDNFNRQIEKYKDLSNWNMQEAQAVLAFDKIFIPVALTGLATSLGVNAETYPYAYTAAWLLLTFWLSLSWRYRKRMDDRFEMMDKFGFDIRPPDRSWPPRDRDLRSIFYIAVIILATVPHFFISEIPIWSYYQWLIPLVISVIIFVAIACNLRKKK